MKKITLKIEGMTCQGCANITKMSLEDVAGVATAQVSFENKTAEVTYDEGVTTKEDLAAAVTEAGFSVV